MDHLRKWLKYQQYLPKQLQIPHSASARACIYYPGHGTRPYEPADTEGWEQGWGASIAELAWGVEWCQPPISGPSCVSLAEGPQGAPVPLLHPFQPGCWKEIDCHLHFLLKSQFGHMNSYSFVWFFFPKNKTNFSAQEWKCPRITWRKGAWSSMVLNNIQAQVFWKRFLSCQGWRTSMDSHALF